MSDGQFTNRRGHSVAVEPDVPEPPARVPVTPRQPVARNPSRRRHRTNSLFKRSLLVFAVLVVGVPVGLGEYVAARYGSEVSGGKQTIIDLVKTTVLPLQGSSLTAEKLQQAALKVDAVRDKLCPGEFFDNLASLYPRAKQSYEACNAYRARVVVLHQQMMEAASQLLYGERLNPLLDSIAKPSEEQFAVLTAQQENWQSFVNSLGQLTPPASLQATHMALRTQSQVILTSWITLVQTANAQDSGQFTATKSKLAEQYAAFRAVAGAYMTAVQTVQSGLVGAYKQTVQ